MYSITKAGVAAAARPAEHRGVDAERGVARDAAARSSSTCRAAASCRSRSAAFPTCSRKFYVSVIKVGESSGTLETAFLRMYEYLGMEKRIRDKVKAALRYPATVDRRDRDRDRDHHDVRAAEVRADLRGARRQPAVGDARADRRVDVPSDVLVHRGRDDRGRGRRASGSSCATPRVAIAGTSSSCARRSSAASCAARRSRRSAGRSR